MVGAPGVEVKDVGGGVVEFSWQMNTGEGDKARSSMTLKLALEKVSLGHRRVGHSGGSYRSGAAVRANPLLGEAGGGLRREMRTAIAIFLPGRLANPWGPGCYLAPGAHW